MAMLFSSGLFSIVVHVCVNFQLFQYIPSGKKVSTQKLRGIIVIEQDRLKILSQSANYGGY